MKRLIVIALASLMTASYAHAADDVITKAMKLYEKRHYEETAALIRSEIASLDQATQGTANLTLGMAYLKNALLHRELYQSATSSSLDYLKKLSVAQGQGRSRFVDFYLGDTLMETGKPGVAVIYLEKFSRVESLEPRYRSLAKVSLGLCYYLNSDAPKGTALWESADASDPEVKAELAAAYSKAGLIDKNPTRMIDETLSVMMQTGKQLSMRMVKNSIAVHARAGMTEKGLELLKRSDLKAYSYREILSKTKIINFYDLALLRDMATLYGQASVMYLEKAAADQKVKDAADFYLGQAYALFGSIDRSTAITASFAASSQMPQQYKDLIRVWQGANLYLKNHVADAVGVWDELAKKQPEDPDLLAEVLFACGRLKIDCTNIVKKSATAVEAGEGKKLSILNVALGKYYFGKLDYAKAVSYLEAGRDKGNKNKIESNDPVMLVNLAGAYYRLKKYSEALEIYFEMSRQFPEVRQIQEAMQGVYAMEHKSAGDVKIN